MRLFVAVCTARRFEGFNPQDLSNVINGDQCDFCSWHIALASILMRQLDLQITNHLHIGFVCRRITSDLHSGLGQLSYYPGDAFVCALTAKCSEHGLQAFKLLELSGLIGVSGAALQLILSVDCMTAAHLLAGRAWSACRGTLTSGISQTRRSCGASSKPSLRRALRAGWTIRSGCIWGSE
jgi:hypothetical protein